MTIRYLVADPTSERRYEVGADRFGFEVPGSALEAERCVTIPAREVLTVALWGPRGQKTRLGVDHRLVSKPVPTYTLGATPAENTALDRAILAYRMDGSPANHAKLMRLQALHVDAFRRAQTEEFQRRTSAR